MEKGREEGIPMLGKQADRNQGLEYTLARGREERRH